jgi:cysteinyl-tRNA synthetase
MKLYNTLTRSVDDVKPINDPDVTVYTCGPTVYDYAHIGHWFNYIRMDILIRVLKSAGYKTKWVMNITDVGHLTSDADEGEDKLEKGAKREGKTAQEVAEFYTQDFLKGMSQLNILKPDHIVKATDHIEDQINLIKRLENKGYTYVIDDGVYYDTSKFEGYASFAQLDLDEQASGIRVAVNTQKRNPVDFALWKFSPKDRQRDMEWDSPWGKGFPGWHIECSAMAMKYLGETIDIHTGGIDHVPIHHTNEIAQSEAATGKRFANYWLHSNHVTVNDEKISKSLGNGIRLQEITGKEIPWQAVRLHILESHYRSQSKFSWKSLEAAHNRFNDIQAMADLRWQLIDSNITKFDFDGYIKRLLELAAQDLNTPELLAYLSKIVSEINEQLVAAYQEEEFNEFLKFLDNILGLQLLGSKNVDDSIMQLTEKREEARQKQDWVKSDELRSKLLSKGVQIRDTAHGPVWSRV